MTRLENQPFHFKWQWHQMLKSTSPRHIHTHCVLGKVIAKLQAIFPRKNKIKHYLNNCFVQCRGSSTYKYNLQKRTSEQTNKHLLYYHSIDVLHTYNIRMAEDNSILFSVAQRIIIFGTRTPETTNRWLRCRIVYVFSGHFSHSISYQWRTYIYARKLV